MSAFSTQEHLIHECFEEVDHLVEVFRDWNQDSSYSMQQLSKGSFQGRLMAVKFLGITIQRLSWNGLVHVLGAKPPHCLTFGTLVQVKGRKPIAHGITIYSDCLFACDQEQEADFITSPEELQIVLVTIEKDLFGDWANKFGYYELNDTFFKGKNVIPLNAIQLTPYREYLQEIHALCEHQPQLLLNSAIGKLIRGDFLPILLNMLQGAAIGKEPQPKQRVEIVQAAQAFMRANLHRPLTLKDICQVIHTSKRSLIYGFQDIFGMGPMRYLKIQRLNGIRRALLVADPKLSKVKDIANAWGFWHLGHFYHDYKKIFGETPSKTLKTLL